MNQQVDDDLSVGGHFDVEGDGRFAVQTLEVATFAEVADLKSANEKEQKQAQRQTCEKVERNGGSPTTPGVSEQRCVCLIFEPYPST
jgi:hypothetical protein